MGRLAGCLENLAAEAWGREQGNARCTPSAPRHPAVCPRPHVPQDWRTLAAPAADAIVAWERRVEQHHRPAFEAHYIKALQHQGDAAATKLLVEFTHQLAGEAGALLDALAADTARRLGLPGVPPDAHLLQLLNAAAEAYAFEPTSDDGLQSDRGLRRGKGAAGAALFAGRAASTE